ncbi:MAG: hypothetical protein LIP01_03365, partial [Tannerellaceae bacterium]|nr:hypothetical protein [Tannerellaceae bacterium]
YCSFSACFCTLQASMPDDPKKCKAVIHLKGGYQLSGNIELPHVNSVSVLLQNGHNEETINSEQIEYIDAWSDTSPADSPVRFIYSPTYEFKSIKSETTELNNQSKWMVCLLNLGAICLYMVAQQYDLNIHEVLTIENIGKAMLPNHWLYLQRPEETYPTRISLSPNSGYGSNQHFRVAGAKYFSDHPELAEKITKTEFTNDTLVEALLFYVN